MSALPDGAAARLRLLYEVTALRTGTAATRLEAALEAVARSLSLDIGVLQRVEAATATIAQVYSPDGALRRGNSAPLEQTYCNLTLKAGGVLSISRMGRRPTPSTPTTSARDTSRTSALPSRCKANSTEP